MVQKPRRRPKISLSTAITRDTLDLEALQKCQGHKYEHGHALVLGGGPGHTGAARLAARAALRIGAGVVTLGVPPSAQMEVAGQITAIMLARIPNAGALDEVLQDKRLTAICLGPGLGLGDEKQDLIKVALKSRRACVLDADACTLIAQSPALFASLHSACILTPHKGEFSRLFPDLAAPDQECTEMARQAAASSGATVLLKGTETVIASPDGPHWLHTATGVRAVPWLATAGSGDVLAGFIAGLLARGFTPNNAAIHATWLHVECARRFGPGLIAEDLPEELPKVLTALGL